MPVKISQLTASNAITSDDFFPIVDSGSMTTLRASAAQILDYVTGSTFNTLTASVALFNGNIRVLGTASINQINTVGQTSLLIGDKYITILSGGVDHTGISGSGFLWGTSSGPGETTGALGEHAHILYDSSRDALEIFPGLYVTGSTTLFQISGTTAQFTTISGTNVLSTNLTGTTALYTTVTGTNVRATTLTLSSLTGSGASANMLVSGSFSGMVAALTSSSTTYTLTAADSGKVVVLSSSSGITASVPTGLPIGFTTTIVQNGTGSILVTGSVASVAIRNRQGHLRTAGLYAIVTLISTGSNGYIFAGDTTT